MATTSQFTTHEQHTKDSESSLRFTRWWLIGTMVVVFLAGVSAFAFRKTSGGQLEDILAPINTLFSGMALLGVMLAVILQKQELEAQRLELRGSRLAQEKMIADNASNRLSDNTFGMHREFHSELMHEARNRAAATIAKHPMLTLQEIHDTVPLSESVHLSSVMGFYHRLALLVEHKQVESDFIPKLFGKVFVWWWVNLFEDRTPPDWENVRSFEYLNDYFTRARDYEIWLAKGREARQRYLQADGTSLSGGGSALGSPA